MIVGEVMFEDSSCEESVFGYFGFFPGVVVVLLEVIARNTRDNAFEKGVDWLVLSKIEIKSMVFVCNQGEGLGCAILG